MARINIAPYGERNEYADARRVTVMHRGDRRERESAGLRTSLVISSLRWRLWFIAVVWRCGWRAYREGGIFVLRRGNVLIFMEPGSGGIFQQAASPSMAIDVQKRGGVVILFSGQRNRELGSAAVSTSCGASRGENAWRLHRGSIVPRGICGMLAAASSIAPSALATPRGSSRIACRCRRRRGGGKPWRQAIAAVIADVDGRCCALRSA